MPVYRYTLRSLGSAQGSTARRARSTSRPAAPVKSVRPCGVPGRDDPGGSSAQIHPRRALFQGFPVARSRAVASQRSPDGGEIEQPRHTLREQQIAVDTQFQRPRILPVETIGKPLLQDQLFRGRRIGERVSMRTMNVTALGLFHVHCVIQRSLTPSPPARLLLYLEGSLLYGKIKT